MSEERLNLIKENVYTRCSIANITGIGITAPDKEEVELIEEIERLNNIIEHTDSWIDRTIEIIKQQPSEDDTWILERLNGIKQCLKGSDKE